MTSYEITDPEFWETETGSSANEVEELKDLADGFEGYEALDFHWYVQQVADRIFNIHLDRGLTETHFLFTLTCNGDGEIDGCEVSLPIPGEGLYLMRSMELKHCTDDRQATGEAGLTAILSALMYEYARLHNFAGKRGLFA